MFSVTDAAFAGFQVLRRSPMTLVWWTGVGIVFSLASMAVLIGLSGDAMQSLASANAEEPDLSKVLDAYARLAPAFLILLPLSLLYYGVFAAAVNRAVLRPEASRFGFLRLGGAEFTQALLLVVIGLIMLVAYIGLGLVGFVVTVVLGMLVGLLGAAGAVIGAAVGAIAMLVILFGGLLAVWTRFSLASPQTFATGRFNLGGSWNLSNKPFWRMFGAYVIAFIIAILVAVVLYGAFAVVVFATGGWAAVTEAFGGGLTSPEAIFEPITLLYYVVAALASSLMGIIAGAPAAYIYDQLAGVKQDEVFA